MSAKIKVLGLGPGDVRLLPGGAIDLLLGANKVFLRTGQHPTVAELSNQGVKFETFDSLYDRFDSFESVYDEMVKTLLSEAETADGGYIVFAVPGHPLVAEAAVRKLLRSRPGAVEVIPGMSFLDAIFARLELDPTRGLKILDAFDFKPTEIDTGTALLICQVYNRLIASDAKLKLMECYPDDQQITVVKAAGVPGEEKVEVVPLFQLDRLPWIDHLTSVYVPSGAKQSRAGYPLDPLVDVMDRLLGPEGCPWDREQTHDSLKRYLIEETYEVLDAIECRDVHKLYEELGDLLLQIVFHAELARCQGSFDINDVVDEVTRKMIRRHPHVFGSTRVNGSEQVLVNWDKIKDEEKGTPPIPGGYLDGIPRGLPALLTSEKIQAKAARIGFDWPNIEGAWAKVEEELAELAGARKDGDPSRIKEEVGDLLFAVVNVARFVDVDPEDALRATVRKFHRRFQHIERAAAAKGKKLDDMDLAEMDVLWEEAKSREI